MEVELKKRIPLVTAKLTLKDKNRREEKILAPSMSSDNTSISRNNVPVYGANHCSSSQKFNKTIYCSLEF